MKVSRLLIVSLVVTVLMVAAAFWLSGMVPEGEKLPIHWNAAGVADNWAEPLTALLVAPAALLFISLLFAVIPSIEPMQDKLEGSAPVMRVVWIGMIALMVVVQGMVAAPAFGLEPQPSFILAAVGVLLVLMGNVLPKSRPGFFVGIRTPWSITDTDNWIATNRLGGKMFIGAGALMMAMPFLPLDESWRFGLVMGAVLFAAFIPMIYSWWFWRQKQRPV